LFPLPSRELTHLSGATAPILGYGALNGILFFTYNRALGVLHESPSSPTSLTKIWAAGAAGGLATFLVSAPTELIKCRAQVSRSILGQTSSLSSLSIAKEIVLRDGVRGLYFGGAVTSIRDAVGYGFYFWSYEICKRVLNSEDKDDSQKVAAAKVLLAGGVAGIITWASIFPLDVIKTRVQTQTFTSSATSPSPSLTATSRLLNSTAEGRVEADQIQKFKRKGALEMARHIYGSEGLKPFFRGLGICSVRAFVVNAVQWAVYEWMMKVLRDSSSDPVSLGAHTM
jgi:solute carrier family 25 carnitine/acylcarnitine transporter 20/29